MTGGVPEGEEQDHEIFEPATVCVRQMAWRGGETERREGRRGGQATERENGRRRRGREERRGSRE